jgi:hypothetical protein
MNEGPQNGVLERILGILPVFCDAINCRQDFSGVAFIEFDERAAVSCLGGRNKEFVAPGA